MEKGYWMIRTIRSGKVIEKSQYFVGERKPRSDRRKGSSTLSKKDKNMNEAVRRLARVLNCNFGKDDLFVTLTYDDAHEPQTTEDAEKYISLFIRRLTRTLGKEVKMKGVWITSDKDEKTGNPVRLHHHLVIGNSGFTVRKDGMTYSALIGEKDLKDIWKAGYVNVEPLKEQDDYTPVAAYLVRQAVNLADAKKWHSSRGMEKPVIESEIITNSPHELHSPPGAIVQEISAYDASTGTHYIRYNRKPRKKGRRNGDILAENAEIRKPENADG